MPDLTASDAFAAVVRQHQAMVYSLARHIVGDAAEAEEVAQEVFCRFYLHQHQLTTEAHQLHWLRQVTTRQAVDRWRRRRIRPRLGLDDIAEPAAPPPPDSDPWQGERLRRAVAALPPEQRVALVLRYQEDLEPRDIARLQQVSVHTVKSRLQRALRALRAHPDFCHREDGEAGEAGEESPVHDDARS